MTLTDEELSLLIDVCNAGPDPGNFDFGPAYEAELVRWVALGQKLHDEQKRRRELQRSPKGEPR